MKTKLFESVRTNVSITVLLIVATICALSVLTVKNIKTVQGRPEECLTVETLAKAVVDRKLDSFTILVCKKGK